MSMLPSTIDLREWKKVESDEDRIELASQFSDALLVDFKIWGECYVNDQAEMIHPGGLYSDQNSIAKFQRQLIKDKNIELLMIGLKSVEMMCRHAHDDGVINFAVVEFSNGRVRFSAKSSSYEDDVSYGAVAEALFWRVFS